MVREDPGNMSGNIVVRIGGHLKLGKEVVEGRWRLEKLTELKE